MNDRALAQASAAVRAVEVRMLSQLSDADQDQARYLLSSLVDALAAGRPQA